MRNTFLAEVIEAWVRLSEEVAGAGPGERAKRVARARVRARVSDGGWARRSSSTPTGDEHGGVLEGREELVFAIRGLDKAMGGSHERVQKIGGRLAGAVAVAVAGAVAATSCPFALSLRRRLGHGVVASWRRVFRRSRLRTNATRQYMQIQWLWPGRPGAWVWAGGGF